MTDPTMRRIERLAETLPAGFDVVSAVLTPDGGEIEVMALHPGGGRYRHPFNLDGTPVRRSTPKFAVRAVALAWADAAAQPPADAAAAAA